MPEKYDVDWLLQLPSTLRVLLGTALWEEVSIGRSGNYVFHIGSTYLKIAPHTLHSSLVAEKERLLWLRGRLPVPEMLYYSIDEKYEYLLLSEIAGVMACENVLKEDMPKLVRLLARGLRMVHSIESADCPFDQRLERKIALARQNMLNGLVDEADFDAGRVGMRVSDLYAQLVHTRADSEDVVFTHGDFCLPNILLDWQNTQVNGFIDWERGGVADRYQDLALAARSLSYNFSSEWVPLLFEEYGIAMPDQRKLEFYKLLDEFF